MIDRWKRPQLVMLRLAGIGLRVSLDENLVGASLPYESLYILDHSEIDFIIVHIVLSLHSKPRA